MKTSAFFVAISIAASTLTGCAIKRFDELECGFSDGSKFVLTADYDWEPMAVLLRSVAEKRMKGSWSIAYQEKEGSPKILAPATSGYAGLNDIALRGACAEVGKINNTPIVRLSFLQNKSAWFPRGLIPYNKLTVKYFSAEEKERFMPRLREVGALSAAQLFSVILNDGNVLVHEQPLLKYDRGYYYDNILVGVFQSVSSDGGETWSDPVVTTRSRFFEIDKSWLNQCFIARPIKINGKKIQPDFPAPCPAR